MKKEKVIICSLYRRGELKEEIEESLNELEGLVKAAGGEVVGRVVQRRESPDPAYYVGRGKVEEIKRLADELRADTLIFDDPLRPVQQRNLEEELNLKILDRTRLIMDIFALRAKTAEGKIQVELAQLQHSLTMLTGHGSELSRLGGGIGTRGPGEKKLEVDRRKIQRRLQKLQRQLKQIEKRRHLQRKRRRGIFSFSLAGYTNAGKSSLLKLLTRDPDIFVKDQLFSTLEARTKGVFLQGAGSIVISDTVGFIRKIPHQLIEAFKATLEEVTQSDAIILVVDSTWKHINHQIETVIETLGEIGAGNKPLIYFFNKVDMLSQVEKERLKKIASQYPDSICGSVKTGEGVEKLKKIMRNLVLQRKLNAVPELHGEAF